MMDRLSWQNVIFQDYIAQFPYSISSREKEIDIAEMLGIGLRQKPFRKRPFYENLLSVLKADPSSVRPHFWIKNETCLFEKFLEEALPIEMVESDVVVRMPPKSRYAIELEVKSIKKAEPKVVEPEGF